MKEQQTSPTPPGSPQGSGEREQDEAMAKWFRVEDTEREADNRRAGHFHAYYYGFDLTGEDAIDLVLRQVCRAGKAFHSTQEWNETYGYDGESSEADQIQEAARRAAESLRAQSQAWEEERAKLGARIENLKAVVREYAPESTAASAETLPVTAIEVRIEEDRQSLASLREENASQTRMIERAISMLNQLGSPEGDSIHGRIQKAIQSLTKSRDANLAESARLRARVEELEGQAREIQCLVDSHVTASGCGCGELGPMTTCVLCDVAAALSSLGEPQGGEVRGE